MSNSPVSTPNQFAHCLVAGIILHTIIFACFCTVIFSTGPDLLIIFIAFYVPHMIILWAARRPRLWGSVPVERRLAKILFHWGMLGSAAGLLLFAGIAITIDLEGVMQYVVGAGFFICAIFVPMSGATKLILEALSVHRQAFYNSHCSHCLYNITAVEANICPECGRPITPPTDAT